MNYQRKAVKAHAREVMGSAHPTPWLVTLVYVVFMGILNTLANLSTIIPFVTAASLSEAFDSLATDTVALAGMGIFTLFLTILSILVLAILQVGYCGYTLKVYRGQQGSYGDLFSGFQRVGTVLAALGLQVLYTVLWVLPAALLLWLGIFLGITLVIANILPATLAIVLSSILYIIFIIYVINRGLRYALIYYILVDHPDWTATQALRESIQLMRGRKLTLVALGLSFLGWLLLYMLVVCLLAGLVILAITLSSSFMPNLLNVTLIFTPLFYYLGILIVSIPFSLWYTTYYSLSFAGFYHCVAEKQVPPPPEAPEQPTF